MRPPRMTSRSLLELPIGDRGQDGLTGGWTATAHDPLGPGKIIGAIR